MARKSKCVCNNYVWMFLGLAIGVGAGYVSRDLLSRVFTQFKDLKEVIQR